MNGKTNKIRISACVVLAIAIVIGVVAGLSALASLGDMMPPTALAGLFAAQVSGVEKYSRVLKRCLIPCIIIMVWAAVVIFFSGTIGGWF